MVYTEAKLPSHVRLAGGNSWLAAPHLGREGNFTGQYSLAGAQSKTALLPQDGRWGVPDGSTPTTHILKPAIGGSDHHDLNEHLCLAAARRAGLLAVRTQVTCFADVSALVVQRFDRRPASQAFGRVHQEDLCLRLAMKIGGDYNVSAGRNAWLRAAAELGLPADALIDRVCELAERAPDAFAEAASAPASSACGVGVGCQKGLLTSSQTAPPAAIRMLA